MIPFWLYIVFICVFFIIIYQWKSSKETFVVAAPMPDDYHIVAHIEKSPPYSALEGKDKVGIWPDWFSTDTAVYPLKGEITRTPLNPALDPEGLKGIGFDLIPDGIGEKPFSPGPDNDYESIKALKEVVPYGHPYRRQEEIGYRWKEGWRPYFWRGYPQPPIFFGAHSPAAGEPELPPDSIILKKEEDPKNNGISPEGYPYFWRLHQPDSSLCAAFADKACRYQSYPLFCFRRTYGKCINGSL
jgi:hypothetical protein